MATNPSTLAENVGRITAPDADYTYGSAKDDTTGTTGDGTPIKEAILNDTYGFQQALLRLAGIVPSGNADTQLVSQYLQGVIQEAMGRAVNFDESGIADAYILDIRTNQQGPGIAFEGMEMQFPAGNVNTGASTVDISDLLGESPGTTVINIKLAGGVTDPSAGQISATNDTRLIYRTSPSVHAELNQSGMTNLVSFTSSGTYTPPANVKSIEITTIGAGGGGGGVDGQGAGTGGNAGGGGGGGSSVLMTNNIEASYTITIGAGGTAGAAAAGAGGVGGNTSAVSSAVNMVSNGGAGGAGQTATSGTVTATGGAGGGSTGGDLDLSGSAALSPRVVTGDPASLSLSGSSMLGGAVRTISINNVGAGATTAGAGGSGAASQDDATNQAGGVGANGEVTIKEFF